MVWSDIWWGREKAARYDKAAVYSIEKDADEHIERITNIWRSQLKKDDVAWFQHQFENHSPEKWLKWWAKCQGNTWVIIQNRFKPRKEKVYIRETKDWGKRWDNYKTIYARVDIDADSADDIKKEDGWTYWFKEQDVRVHRWRTGDWKRRQPWVIRVQRETKIQVANWFGFESVQEEIKWVPVVQFIIQVSIKYHHQALRGVKCHIIKWLLRRPRSSQAKMLLS